MTRTPPLRALLRLAAILLVLGAPTAAPASGQATFGGFGAAAQHARAELFTRVEGEVVRAVLRVAIDPGWHLYHTELGHPDAIGLPTRVELAGDGVVWGPPRLPEPARLDQPGFGAFILSHEGTIAIRAAGRVEPGATPGAVSARITGQTCDEASCVNYDQRVESSGAGPDELFAGFPDDLLPRPEVQDRHAGGEADASLYVRRSGRSVEVAIEVEIAPGWHLYHTELGNEDAVGKPTVVELAAEGVRFEPVSFPAPIREPQLDGWVLAHEGTIVLRAAGRLEEGVDEPGAVTAELSGLTCQDGEGGKCVLYGEVLADRGPGRDELFAPARTGGEVPTEGGGSGDLAAFLLSAVFWGFVTLLMPCTYPMIPITISFFTKQAADRRRSVLPLALAYGLGIVLIFVLIGVTLGPPIIRFATHPVTNLAIAGLFVFFALVLFGVVNLQPPRFLLDVAGRASAKGGVAGVFLMGATLVVTSFTCTAPFVGTLLTSGAAKGMAHVALGMGVFGLTMAVPFVALALVPGLVSHMPRSGQWMNSFKVFMGFVELAAALKFLSNSDLVWEWELVSRELFLLLWVVIFGVAAAWLLGLVPWRGSLAGRARLAGAGLVLAFTGYCAWGMLGRELDGVMTAIVPNYSGGRLMPKWRDFGHAGALEVDDYDAAVARAREGGELLLANFTGHTCVNCRQMEEKIFRAPAVAGILAEDYVEARLHTDGKTNIARILELQQELARTVATPVYVIVDPATGSVLRRFEGATRDADRFAEFLQGGLRDAGRL